MDRNFDLGVADQDAFVAASRRFTVGDLLHKRARMNPDGVAVSVPDREVTFAELEARVHRLANALRDRGHEPGEATFAILSENRPEYVEVLYAGAVLGCLVGAQNTRLERAELTHCIDTVDPDVLFVSGRHYEKVEWVEDEGEGGGQAEPEYVAFDDVEESVDTTLGNSVTSLDYDELLAAGSDDPPLPDNSVDPEQGFAVMYTSGTTGMPKAAVVSHRAEFGRTNQVIVDYGLETGDSYPAWAPMYHMAGIDWVVTTHVLGGTYYPIDGFDVDRIIEVLQTADGALSWLILFPGMLDRLLDALEETSSDPKDYQPLRTIGSLPDLMNPETLAGITAILDAPAQNTYGSTEIGHATSGNQIPPGVEPNEERLRKEESPFVQVRLVDTEREPVERGESGEVAVRGPPLFSGYVDAPEANRREIEDGWFYTGDVMQWHEDGTYSYLSRRKYMIKTGGENVYPAEIEDVLIGHDRVTDVCVVRTPDDRWGEVPRAVVGSPDADDIDPEDLLAMLEGELANYKLPHYIQVVDPEEFPRSTTGKIVREDVEDWPYSEEDRVREV